MKNYCDTSLISMQQTFSLGDLCDLVCIPGLLIEKTHCVPESDSVRDH